MSSNRASEASRQAAAKMGLAPGELLIKARPGAVFLVDDAMLELPESRLSASGRTLHDFRHAIVAQAASWANGADPKSILVVPCSASHRGPVRPWDYEIPSGEKAFSAPKVVAYTSLVQPVLKRDLRRFEGNLSSAALTEFLARLAGVTGLTRQPQMTLPPRPPGL